MPGRERAAPYHCRGLQGGVRSLRVVVRRGAGRLEQADCPEEAPCPSLRPLSVSPPRLGGACTRGRSRLSGWRRRVGAVPVVSSPSRVAARVLGAGVAAVLAAGLLVASPP